jgi:Zn-dependent protease
LSRALNVLRRLGEVKLPQRFTLLWSATTLRPLRTPGSQGARASRPLLLHTLQTILLVGPVLLFSVIAHEIAHGYVALLQGDRTALEAGRLSWNPVRHIDPFMTILLPLIMILGSMAVGGPPVVLGGAKPVPVDPRNYRHLRRGDILVSLAGVATNLLVALVCVGLIAAAGGLAHAAPSLETTLGILQAMFVYGILLNAVLVAFNLLPIPPLDGSHVLKYLLPRPLAVRYVRFGRYGIVVLFLLLSFGQRALDFWLSPAFNGAEHALGFVGTSILPTASQWLN